MLIFAIYNIFDSAVNVIQYRLDLLVGFLKELQFILLRLLSIT